MKQPDLDASALASPAHKSCPSMDAARSAAPKLAGEANHEVDGSPPASPEIARTYRGEIISATATTVIQRVRDGEHGHNVRHERAELHGRACAQLVEGARVEIRYPSPRLGFVSEWGTRERLASVARGVQARSLGD